MILLDMAFFFFFSLDSFIFRKSRSDSGQDKCDLGQISIRSNIYIYITKEITFMTIYNVIKFQTKILYFKIQGHTFMTLGKKKKSMTITSIMF